LAEQPASACAGLAITPLLAAWAAHGASASQLLEVPPDPPGQAATLAPIGLPSLPGLAPTLQRELHALRIFTLGDLAALPTALLMAVFGKELGSLQALARGADPRWVPVALMDPCLSAGPALAMVRRALPADPRRPLTPVILAEELAALTAGLAAALAISGRAATRLTLTLGYSAGALLTRAVSGTAPATTPAALYAIVVPMLAALLRARRRHPAWLELAVTRVIEPVHQPALPLPSVEPDPAVRLATAIATIHQRFGPHVLHHGLPAPRHGLHPSPRS
jgi:nucleotidyltransferase/DNA polymerase involved in DNA repair